MFNIFVYIANGLSEKKIYTFFILAQIGYTQNEFVLIFWRKRTIPNMLYV